MKEKGSTCIKIIYFFTVVAGVQGDARKVNKVKRKVNSPCTTAGVTLSPLLVCILIFGVVALVSMSSATTGDVSPSASSRPRRFYGRSATTSVTQLLSESDVVKTCTNLIQRLTTKNLGLSTSGSSGSGTSGSRASEFNGSDRLRSSGTMLRSTNNGPPDSPKVEYKPQRKNSGGSICSNDPYNFVKYKPPLPTSTNHTSSGGDGVGKGGSSRLSFSYFGNDRLKELEQKFSERYSRIFGSSANVSNSVGSGGTDANGNTTSGSGGSRERSGLRNHRSSLGSKEALNLNGLDDYSRNVGSYGLSKSASTCGAGTSALLSSGGSGRHIPSYGGSQTGAYGSTLGLGPADTGGSGYLQADGTSRGSAANIASNGSGSRLSVTNLNTPTSRNVDYNVRRNYGLAKSASSSVIQDAGRYGGLTSALTNALPTGSSTASAISKYYNPYLSTYAASRLYASNSHLLEPVPEQHNHLQPRPRVDSGGYAMIRSSGVGRDMGRDASNSVCRSSTLNNLVDARARMDSADYRDDSRAGTVKADSDDEDDDKTISSGVNATSGGSGGGGSRKNSYKLPSRYYYRRYRHKSSYAPKEASPLSLTNGNVNNGNSSRTGKATSTEDEDNNNVTKSSALSRTSSYNNSNGSHVLAYDLTPRNKALKDAEDLLYGTTTAASTTSGSSGYDTGGESGKENLKMDTHSPGINGGEGSSDVDLVRKKEIEDLIRKYSGFTYKSSKYVQLKKPGAEGGASEGEKGGTCAIDEKNNNVSSDQISANRHNHLKPSNSFRATTAANSSALPVGPSSSAFTLQSSKSGIGLGSSGGAAAVAAMSDYYGGGGGDVTTSGTTTESSKGYLSSKESNAHLLHHHLPHSSNNTNSLVASSSSSVIYNVSQKKKCLLEQFLYKLDIHIYLFGLCVCLCDFFICVSEKNSFQETKLSV